ncbi:MAG: efflux RND transporter periplasmic adaptor subunit, partial [Pyrinomonadaceae bacterium]|nr:efflux RND transporter periplasmic adaptor subunit [Pyrinomonadaceae bacterium]
MSATSHSLNRAARNDSAANLKQTDGARTENEDASAVEETRPNLNGTKRRRRNIVIVLVLLIASLLIIYFSFFRSKTKTDATDEAEVIVSVRTAKVEQQGIASRSTALGTIFPREQAIVSTNIGGQIKAMRLLKNQVVRQGEVIAQLDVRDLQAQRAEAAATVQSARLQARGVTTGAIPQTNAQTERDLRDARAGVANARALYERRRDLYGKGGIALKEVEAAQLALTTAENNLRLVERTASLRTSAINPNDQAQAQSAITQAEQRMRTIDAQLSFANIRSPLTGVVTEQFQFQGEYAASGARLVTIADTSEVIVKAQFADTVVADMKMGDSATILPNDLPGERMGGRVSLISRSSDPQNRTVEVWVNLGNAAGRLRTGSAAQVLVATNTANEALVVPASAVTLDATDADTGTVMLVDKESIARETKVK